MKRRNLSDTVRVEIFHLRGGVCHCCGGRIEAGQAWAIEHVLPLADGGDDVPKGWRAHKAELPANIQIVHQKGCHATKTAGEAVERARANRRYVRHIGAKAPSARPIPGSRCTPFKRRFDGSVVRRDAR